jgi:hypothetical protein
MFAGLGVEVEDEYAPSFDAPDAANPSAGAPDDGGTGDGVYGYQAETRVHEVDQGLLQQTTDEPKGPSRGAEVGARVGRATVRALWFAIQAVLLVSFLTLSVVYARGGNVDDVLEGRAADVVLGRVDTSVAVDEPLRAEDVVVARRPVTPEPGLVAISGVVANDGSADAPAVRVTVTLGEDTFEGWAGTDVTGLHLDAVANASQLDRLLALTPEDAAVPVGERRPFVVLARGVRDGARADVSVAVDEPPPPPAPVVEPEPPAEGDEPVEGSDDDKDEKVEKGKKGGKGKKGRLRLKKQTANKPGAAGESPRAAAGKKPTGKTRTTAGG